MKSLGVEFDAHTYVERVKLIPQNKVGWDKFQVLWTEMKKRKVEMPSHLQAVIGNFLQRSNNEKSITTVLREIESEFGVPVHHHYLNAMLGLYAIQNQSNRLRSVPVFVFLIYKKLIDICLVGIRANEMKRKCSICYNSFGIETS